MSSLMIITLVILGILGFVVMMYNGLVGLRNRVREAISDIGVQQKRRHNLIPNLVEAVKGYAGHEAGTLQKVTEARTAAMSAGESGNVKEMQAAENMLSGTLKSIFALSESYPDLKANQNFLQLQDELVDAENKIQAARRFYNNNVQSYNTKVEQFPGNLIAKQFSFEMFEFFEVEEEATAVPEVKF